MNISPQEQRVLAQVLQMLGTGTATSQHLEDYLIGYAVLGRLVSMAQGEAETAEQTRKLAWARAFSDAKLSEAKPSDRLAEAMAEVEVSELKTAEIRAREKLSNLKATREAVQEAIWAIKFVERQGG